MVIGVTGHRIITGLGFKDRLRDQLTRLKPEKVIAGMAWGFDHAVCFMCIELGIPFVAALPFSKLIQTRGWNTVNKLNYDILIKRAHEVVTVVGGRYHPSKYHKRNKWIVDQSDMMIAYYDQKGNSGTAQTVNYALSIGREVINIYDNNQSIMPTMR